MTPSLSVVVPTHDTRALTLACLGALAPELPADAQVIVVDDGGSDGTGEAVRAAFPAVQVLRRASPGGFTVAANAGLAAATGRIVLLLNSDTEVAPGALAALVAAFARAPRLGVAGAALHGADGAPQWSGGPLPTPRWLFALASGLAAAAGRLPGYRRARPVAGHGPAPIAWVSGAALAVRAEALRAVGALDERFRLYAQDLDLCRRVRAAGFEVTIVPGARVLHRGGATIGRLAGATSRAEEPVLLWTDLVRATEKHEGAAAARRAARALRAGAALRIAARIVATPFVAAERRAAWRRDTAAYARARRALAVSA